MLRQQTLRYDPEEPPPSPRKRKADAVDDNDLANAKKKQRVQCLSEVLTMAVDWILTGFCSKRALLKRR